MSASSLLSHHKEQLLIAAIATYLICTLYDVPSYMYMQLFVLYITLHLRVDAGTLYMHMMQYQVHMVHCRCVCCACAMASVLKVTGDTSELIFSLFVYNL